MEKTEQQKTTNEQKPEPKIVPLHEDLHQHTHDQESYERMLKEQQSQTPNK